MARIRSIKPQIFQSTEVMDCKRDTRLLFVGTITQADDHGRGVADPRKFKGCVFPGDDDITTAIIRDMFVELSTNRLIYLYPDGTQSLIYQLRRWSDHQVVDRAKPSTLPSPPIEESSSNDRRTNVGESPGMEGLKDGGKDKDKGCGYVDNSTHAKRAPGAANGHKPPGARAKKVANGDDGTDLKRRRADLARQGKTAAEIMALAPDQKS